jgi:hypothetical protein
MKVFRYFLVVFHILLAVLIQTLTKQAIHETEAITITYPTRHSFTV